jgi:hypothetical protein
MIRKKVIFVEGDPDISAQVGKTIAGAKGVCYSMYEPIADVIKVGLCLPQGKFPKNGMVIRDHHVRRMFDRLARKIVPVQKYAGKKINSLAEGMEHFAKAGEEVIGPGWLVDLMTKKVENARLPVVVVTDATREEMRLLDVEAKALLTIFAEDVKPEDNDPEYEFIVHEKAGRVSQQALAGPLGHIRKKFDKRGGGISIEPQQQPEQAPVADPSNALNQEGSEVQ